MRRTKYTDELRERSASIKVKALTNPARTDGMVRRISKDLDTHPKARRSWDKKAQVDSGPRPRTTTDEVRQIKEFENKVRQHRRANTVLKSTSACL